MSALSPAEAIRSLPDRSFVRVSELPGSAVAARQAASRAARKGDLIPVRRGLYYRGAPSRYGMTRPPVEDVVREVLGTVGHGPAGFSAAREWAVTTQIPAIFHVAVLWPVDPIAGVAQYSRRNRARVGLTEREIALLELLRDPDTYVEAGWGTLIRNVKESVARNEVSEERLRAAMNGERNLAAQANYLRLVADAR